MISENLSHDSKVWTKEYDLNGELTRETGDEAYDNLPGYEYIDSRFDTYRYVRKTPKGRAEKIVSGYKVCRYAQYPEGTRAIMPSILQELLKARKDTRKLIEVQTDDFMKETIKSLERFIETDPVKKKDDW
jgi:hypothetical protein